MAHCNWVTRTVKVEPAAPRQVGSSFAGVTAAAAATGTVLFFYTDFRRARGSEAPATALGLGLRGSF
jgi:hypothetical protein